MADNKVYEIKESAISDPGPLGLACFALTTFCLSMVNAGLVVAESVAVVCLGWFTEERTVLAGVGIQEK